MTMPDEARVRAALLAGALTLVAVALLAPWLRSPWLYALAHPICHQRLERCFWFAGLPMAFCARCLGIYTGAALALLVGLGACRRAFLAALALVFLDLLSEAAGLRGPWAAGRFATGLLAGGAAAPIVLREMRMSDCRTPALKKARGGLRTAWSAAACCRLQAPKLASARPLGLLGSELPREKAAASCRTPRGFSSFLGAPTGQVGCAAPKSAIRNLSRQPVPAQSGSRDPQSAIGEARV